MTFINTNDIMFLLYLTICCICTVLFVVLVAAVYILSSARVRAALVTLSLIKTIVDLFKDIFFAAKTVRNKTKSSKTTKKNSSFIDAEFRDKD